MMDSRQQKSAKTTRLEARLTPVQKSMIERAAALEGRSISDFVVNTVQQAAKTVIAEYEVLRLNGEESRAFVERILNPPEPNKALKQAACDYRDRVVSR
jgi:uncharacterized protein (DUF1778 family)